MNTPISENDLALRQVLIEVLLIDDDQYRDDYGPAQIGSWDSLGMIEIALAVEQRFGVALQPEQMVTLQTIGELKGHLREQGVAI